MTYKRALELSIAFALGYALYSVVTKYLFPNLWTPTTTRLEDYFERVYFTTVGIFYAVWSIKHDNP
jgi:hypothetical protein